jgi:hypothetical protein
MKATLTRADIHAVVSKEILYNLSVMSSQQSACVVDTDSLGR